LLVDKLTGSVLPIARQASFEHAFGGGLSGAMLNRSAGLAGQAGFGRVDCSLIWLLALTSEGWQHLNGKQSHLPINLIDSIVAEQPYVSKRAHQVV
jgi:hypothetical protein